MSDFVICDGYDSLYILNVFQALFLQLLKLRSQLPWSYCAFHKHANSKVQKSPSQLRFSLPSIIITITNSEPGSTETHKTDRNPPITNHKPWPFEPVKVKFCFLRTLLRWLTAAKNAIVSWLLNFRIRMFVKSAVTWDQALYSFRFENYIPAGMAKQKESLIQTFYETSAAHFFDWLTFAESANQNYFRCLFF